MISQYWIGQIPVDPLHVDIKDQAANPIDLSIYDRIVIQIQDPDNYTVPSDQFDVDLALLAQGRIVLKFPTNYSIFRKTGEYLLRLEFSNSGAIEFSTSYSMMVYEFGGKKVNELGVVA
jgi:hypothetical protein